MSIAKFCIKHRVTTLMAVIMITIFGVVFAGQLQMALLPDMEAPRAPQSMRAALTASISLLRRDSSTSSNTL